MDEKEQEGVHRFLNAMESMRDFIKLINKEYPNVLYKVAGSVALIECGLKINRYPNDIDIVMSADARLANALHMLECSSNCVKSHEYEGDEDHFTFVWKGTTIDVWLTCDKGKFTLCSTFEKNGIVYAPVHEVIEYKKKYGRAKDYRDLNQLANLFTSK